MRSPAAAGLRRGWEGGGPPSPPAYGAGLPRPPPAPCAPPPPPRGAPGGGPRPLGQGEADRGRHLVAAQAIVPGRDPLEPRHFLVELRVGDGVDRRGVGALRP